MSASNDQKKPPVSVWAIVFLTTFAFGMMALCGSLVGYINKSLTSKRAGRHPATHPAPPVPSPLSEAIPNTPKSIDPTPALRPEPPKNPPPVPPAIPLVSSSGERSIKAVLRSTSIPTATPAQPLRLSFVGNISNPQTYYALVIFSINKKGKADHCIFQAMEDPATKNEVCREIRSGTFTTERCTQETCKVWESLTYLVTGPCSVPARYLTKEPIRLAQDFTVDTPLDVTADIDIDESARNVNVIVDNSNPVIQKAVKDAAGKMRYIPSYSADGPCMGRVHIDWFIGTNTIY